MVAAEGDVDRKVSWWRRREIGVSCWAGEGGVDGARTSGGGARPSGEGDGKRLSGGRRWCEDEWGKAMVRG